MKLKSFRFRIALLSALLAGTAIAGFSGVTYFLFYQSKLNAIDNDIKDQLLRESQVPKPTFHWQTYEKNRSSFLGNQSQSDIALLVIDPNGKTIHQSENWQIELAPDSLFPNFPDSAIANPRPLQLDRLDRRLPRPQPNRNQSDLNPPFAPPLNKLEQPPNLNLERPQEGFFEVPRNLSNLVTRNISTGKWRMGTVSAPFIRIAIAVNLQVIDREMSAIQNVFLIAVPLTLLLVMLGAWWLSGDALRPIKNITATIRRVNAKGLNQRTSVADTDVEFVELVQVFNQMMERLERSFLQASRFSADAAHELKTPLAILQGELELALQHTETGSKMQQTLSNLLDEVCRLSSITRKLLLLSLADAGRMNVQAAVFNFSQVLDELAEDIEILAPELKLTLDISPNLKVLGDRELLTQVLQNLINNAIKYNLPDGWIQLLAKPKGNILFVTVNNSSQDIPAGDRDRIFDRFHRADPSRNRQIEGFGLGLSLSREIARAHNGNLQLDGAISGSTSFTLTLPIHSN
ncbi:MAG: two-component sensor histidine kinase [Pseudanabaena frigida]|uniref:histidine kinase n=1 Tax=Pseudanabaena frigida TaxID=945775 RepID=A0A2W4XP52_9CYAN|nr:MAG: two-component sensor histidine kinase [Pseudanabaena frigida]